MTRSLTFTAACAVLILPSTMAMSDPDWGLNLGLSYSDNRDFNANLNELYGQAA